MTKVLVLCYSMYGHIETMVGAIAEGAKSVEGVDGSRQPSATEVAQAKFQAAHVAKIAAKLVAGV